MTENPPVEASFSPSGNYTSQSWKVFCFIGGGLLAAVVSGALSLSVGALLMIGQTGPGQIPLAAIGLIILLPILLPLAFVFGGMGMARLSRLPQYRLLTVTLIGIGYASVIAGMVIYGMAAYSGLAG